jgi:NADH:ubiquinone oxidoreductase subunit F (NADH-binding)
MSKNLRGLSGRKGLTNSLYREIVIGNLSQSENKESLLEELSDKYLVGKSSLLSAGSFYDFLKTEHSEKKVFICNGTACLTSGKQEKLKSALLDNFHEEEIGQATCLGHCHTNNAFMYNHKTYSLDNLNSLDTILNSEVYKKTSFNVAANSEKPALICPTGDLHDYYGILKQIARNIPLALREIEISTLLGKGGAGFPFHFKLKTAANISSGQKYIVCNGDEGDPGAYSDKWLLEERPHSVLFGMMASGLIAGADTVVIYIRGEYPESATAVKAAISQIEQENLTLIKGKTKNIQFKFQVVEGSGAYICGEETSLLNSIEGLRPEVRTRPPFPANYGLFGKPTVLSNVETFANIWFILSNGGAAYSALGIDKSTGSKLVCLDSAFANPGIYEVRMGTPLSVVLNEMGGGTKFPVKAFQIGGPLGGIIPYDMINDLVLDNKSFVSAGFLLGHAGVVSIPADFPMIKFIAHLFEFTSRESCGKCIPCRIGSVRGFELLKRTIEKKEKISKELFSDLLETMQLGSLCALGGGLPLPVNNTLRYFNGELDEFFTSKSKYHE